MKTSVVRPMLVLVAALGVGSAADAAGSAAAGGAQFRARCGICHKAAPEANSIGPTLYGVFGRKAGTAPGYHYSDAMVSAGTVWDEASLDAFLKSPNAAVPGTKMSFAGMADAGQRADLVAFLRTLGEGQP
ncbi:c-type cytochrome [Hansschlegelia beijingensis]|uniref:Cytochrome c n=1 Tax=Hansschlegelia beijingensis TaxID=1133344 RepID=A0A7W6GE27_9HYPH|nr:c-type cytochrome [Hansschlegelia beijingensis]MBB3971628.1 cytochrome c [Hansschlegelia beijingensis]